MFDQKLIRILSADVKQMCNILSHSCCEMVMLIVDRTAYSTLTFGSSVGLDFISSSPDVLSMFTEYCKTCDRVEFNIMSNFDSGASQDGLQNKRLENPSEGYRNMYCEVRDNHKDVPSEVVTSASSITEAQGYKDKVVQLLKDGKDAVNIFFSHSTDPINRETFEADITTVAANVKESVAGNANIVDTVENQHGTVAPTNSTCTVTVETADSREDKFTGHKGDMFSLPETVIEDSPEQGTTDVKLEALSLPSFQCTSCHITFVSKAGLTGHKKFHNRSDMKSNGSKQTSKRRPRKEYSCDICMEKFPSWYLRKNHLITHGPKKLSCDKCEESFHFQTELRAHSKVHANATKFMCHICPRRYEQRNRFNEHLKSHDTANYVNCEECGKCIFKKVLRKHMSIHSIQKNFMCQICGKAYVSDTHLRNHLNVHDNVRKYKCRYCDASFKKSDTLKVHENAIHTKECRYVCDTCGVQYLRKSSLRLHQQWHIYGSYRCKCRYCQTVFRNHARLMTHIKHQHSKEDLAHEKPTLKQCKQCGKVFGQVKPFKIHLDMHAGIKRYSCSLCGKTFGSPTNLREHKRIHDGSANKHRCDVCNIKLRNAKRLQVHMESHTDLLRQNHVQELPGKELSGAAQNIADQP